MATRNLAFSSHATLFILDAEAWIDAGNGTLSLYLDSVNPRNIRFEIRRQNEPSLIFQLLFTNNKAMKQKGSKAWVLKAQAIDSLDAPEATDTKETKILAVRLLDEYTAEAFKLHVDKAMNDFNPRRPSINPLDALREQSKSWTCQMCTFENPGSKMLCDMCKTWRTTDLSRDSVSTGVQGEGEGEVGEGAQNRQVGEGEVVRGNSGVVNPFSPEVSRDSILSEDPSDILPSEDAYGDKQEGWLCQHCTFSNSGFLNACEMCLTAKPEADHHDSNLDTMMSANSNQWTCPSCTLVNQNDVDKCRVCSQPNPNPSLPPSNPGMKPRKFSTIPVTSQNRGQAAAEDFERIAHIIASVDHISTDVFTVLRIVTRKLLKPDLKYRTLDTTLPRVQEGLLGFEGVLEFLQLLGFKADESMTKLVIEPDQPPEGVIKAALGVIEKKIEYMKQRMESHKIRRQVLSSGDGNTTRGPNQQADNSDDFNLNQLVTFITHEHFRDEQAHKVVILCHATFTTSLAFLTTLRNRYFLQDQDRRLVSRRGLKVGNVLKYWIKCFWEIDFEEDPEVLEYLEMFVQEMQSYPEQWSRTLGINISNLVDSQKQRSADDIAKKRKASIPVQIPTDMTLKGLQPDVVAEQLCLIDQEIFCEIQPRECLNQNWKKKNNKELAPNIMAMIEQFNHVCKWIQIEILLCRSLRERAKFMKKALKIAKYCLEYQNFTSLCAIYSALNAAPIHRLSHAWEKVQPKEKKIYDEIKAVFSHHRNQKNLRAALRTAKPPSVPHIGIFLQDLVFIEEGNETTRKDLGKKFKKTINLSKCNRLFERIEFMKGFQKKPYEFKSKPPIEAKLYADFKGQEKMTEDQLWRISTEVKQADMEASKKGWFN